MKTKVIVIPATLIQNVLGGLDPGEHAHVSYLKGDRYLVVFSVVQTFDLDTNTADELATIKDVSAELDKLAGFINLAGDCFHKYVNETNIELAS